MSKELLTAEHLFYTPPGYDSPLYKDFSFSLREGELVLLAGSNGCGKSTLLKLLSGFLTPEKGSIVLGGRPCKKWDPYERSRLLGYSPQGLPEFSGFTVRELVTAGCSGGAFGGYFLSRKEKDRIENALDSMDLLPLADRLCGSLSTGEFRRGAIAAILAKEPPILLLDEPTAALDFYHGELLMRLLEKLRQKGTAIILAAHDLLVPVPFATRVLLLKKGRIVAGGTPEATLTKENLYETFGCHFEVTRSARNTLTFSLEI